MNLDAIRNTRPFTEDGLWNWVYAFTGVKVARTPVCRHHQPPWEAFRTWWFDDPMMSLMLGPRGGGKSFLAALRTHLRSRWNPGHAARVLGGSKAQSQQIYEAIRKTICEGQGPLGSDQDTIARLMTERAHYHNGSQVEILASSSRSVRGPHIPLLLLDEVDEIAPENREAAFGMCVADTRRGIKASVSMTSTWHKVGGPMAGLIEEARGGRFPFHQFCIFEVLERCPAERSGSHLEKCPECPLVRWCHADRDEHGGVPKAKRSDGHYAIDALIQKVIGVSTRVFEADYLCTGPRADGLWFPEFSRARHVSEQAEFDPALPVHLAVDSGVHSGVVWFQIAETAGPFGAVPTVRVFADYYSFGKIAFEVARDIRAIAGVRCQGRLDHRSTDPAGGARNPIGPTVLAEYLQAGLQVDRWPGGSVADGLGLVESFVGTAAGTINLAIHPRCVSLIHAFENYARARRGGQWTDQPEDPQHPHEDLMDALRGGLRKAFPSGRRPQPKLSRVPAHRMF
jgi:hypothetical protein